MQIFKKTKSTSYLATTSAYKQFKTLKIIGVVSGVLFGLGSIGTMFFLYRSVYIPIGTSENIIITEPLSIEVIDFRGVDQVEEQWKKKGAMETSPFSRNPFYPTSTTGIATTPTKQTTTSTEPEPQPQPSEPATQSASSISHER